MSPNRAVPQHRRSTACGGDLPRVVKRPRTLMRLEDDHPNVYYNFQKGQRVIRRSGQVLLCAVNRYHHHCICSHGRSAKSRWGLTRGRGMNEVHRLTSLPAWDAGMFSCKP